MQIRSARFVTSNTDFRKCPAPDRPEYAFIGRSNVGKSSLINALTKQKKLAMTSSTPGKTKLINHFLVNDEWYLVDLPGYGYAQFSKTERQKVENMIRGYLGNRENLMCLFVLVDIRHEPRQIDLEFMMWAGGKGIPFMIIFTKADKLSGTAIPRQIAIYREKMLETWEEMPPHFVTSSEKGEGMDAILAEIAQINRSFEPLA